MFTPVLCFTCGFPVGDYEKIFQSMKTGLVQKALDERKTSATQAAVDAGLELQCKKILDTMGVNNDCCRKTLVSAMLFEAYN